MALRSSPAFICVLVLGAAPSLCGADAPPTRSFELTASRYEFQPAQIEVDQGDRVLVKVRSTDTVHGFAIKEFRVKLLVPKSGEVVTTEFTADKAGTFRFACSEYCGNGHSRMKGVLVVRPKGGAR